MLSEVNHDWVLDGVKDNINIRIPHHLPLLHYQLFEILDCCPQGILLIFMDELQQVIKYVVDLVNVLFSLFWVLCPSVRPLFFFLFKQIDPGGPSFAVIFSTDVLDMNLRRGATELAPPKQGSEWWFGGNSSLYRVRNSIFCRTLANFLHQPITILYSPAMIDFLAQWVELRCRSKESHLQAPPAGTLHMQLLGET